MRKPKITTEIFKEKSSIKHSNYYDYSLSIYKSSFEKIDIICPQHGLFRQRASDHLYGKGCIKCSQQRIGKQKRGSKQNFVEKANVKHNYFYSYDKTVYTHAKEFVIITCPLHGDFKQRPNYHLNGNGCYQCYVENSNFGLSKFRYSCQKNNKNVGILYVIQCHNSSEEFIKIGITSTSVEKRFNKRRFPYCYKVLYTIEKSPEYIFHLEKYYHRLFKNSKYIPEVDFKGKTECFNINLKNYDFRRNEKSLSRRAEDFVQSNKK